MYHCTRLDNQKSSACRSTQSASSLCTYHIDTAHRLPHLISLTFLQWPLYIRHRITLSMPHAKSYVPASTYNTAPRPHINICHHTCVIINQILNLQSYRNPGSNLDKTPPPKVGEQKKKNDKRPAVPSLFLLLSFFQTPSRLTFCLIGNITQSEQACMHAWPALTRRNTRVLEPTDLN